MAMENGIISKPDNGAAKPVDVICLHEKDGTMVPLRIRVEDEEGMHQAYSIKGYRDLSHQGTRVMPDGVYVSDRTLVFECNITAFGRNKMIRLYYEPNNTVWRMTP